MKTIYKILHKINFYKWSLLLIIMRFFKKKRNDVLDLTDRYRKQQRRALEIGNGVQESPMSSEDNAGGLGFFGAIANTVSNSDQDSQGPIGYSNFSNNAEEKRRKLSKRLMDMTEKIEDLSNQIYHLQQRIEVLERKLDVGRF